MRKTFKYKNKIKKKHFIIIQENIGLFNIRSSTQLGSQINILEQKTKHGNQR